MPQYRITAPDGSQYDVSGDGTEEEALAHFQSTWQPAAAETAAPEAPRERTVLESLKHGAGMGARMVANAVTGTGQMLGDALVAVPNALGAGIPKTSDTVQKYLTKAGMPAPTTTGEKVTDFLGTLALSGKLDPAAVAAASKMPKTPTGPGTTLPMTEKQLTQEAGQDLGMKLSPTYVSKTPGGDVMQVFAGEGKVKELARINNEAKGNAATLLQNGLRPGIDQLNHKTLDSVISKAVDEGYEPVRKAGFIPTPALKQNIALVRAQWASGRTDEEIKKLNDALKPFEQNSLTGADALSYIQTAQDKANDAFKAGEGYLGKAFKDVKKLLEATLEQGLTTKGDAGKELVAGYVDARKRIAVAHATKEALDEGSGNVDLTKFGKMLNDEAPLSGSIAALGRFANANPHSVKSPLTGEVAPFDKPSNIGASIWYGINQTTGGPLRKVLMSDRYQNSLRPSARVKTPGSGAQTLFGMPPRFVTSPSLFGEDEDANGY